MNKYLVSRLCYTVATILFVLVAGKAGGQKLQVPVLVNNTVITDLQQSPLNDPAWKGTPTTIVAPDFSSKDDARAGTSAAGKFKIWLEYGDGGFTTSDNSAREFGAYKYPAMLMVMPLYDTSKGKDGTIARGMLDARYSYATGARKSDNDNALLASGENIKLTPATGDIVLGEPMALAVTYRTPASKKVFTNVAPATRYFAVLYYNSNNVNIFSTLSKTATTGFIYSGSQTIKDVRIFANQAFPASAPALPAMPVGYQNYFVVELAPEQVQQGVQERNFFVTLKATGDTTILQQAQNSSIIVSMVALSDGVPTIMGSDTLFNMRLERAFDPNHITVNPTCLVLPKGETVLTYRLDFQNLGKGDADMVKVILKRPPGINPASFNILSVKYSGNDVSILNNTGNDPRVNFTHIYDAANNIDTFFFASAPGAGILLRGTGVSADALSNPLTMGEIVFTVKTTASVQDRMECKAFILFHSNGFADNDWEAPVLTNTALTVYKAKACECDNSCPANCYKILGLCWWWWMLIILVIIILIWWLRRRR